MTRTKSADGMPAKPLKTPGNRIVVLRVFKVAVISGSAESFDTKATRFLDAAGFHEKSVTQMSQYVSAKSPNQDAIFRLEYTIQPHIARSKDHSKDIIQPTFKLWRIRAQDTCLIESGTFIGIDDGPNSKGEIEVIATGTKMSKWRMICKSPTDNTGWIPLQTEFPFL